MISNDNLLLETAFNTLNKIYFNNELPEVAITIQSNAKSYGYITINKVWKDTEYDYHEINISAEHLNRNIENVMATLLHEMVHLYCMVNDIKDTSNGGRYHNKNFKHEAEKRDLIIEYAPVIGHSITTPSVKFIEGIKANGLYTNISHCRTTGISSTTPPTGGSDSGDDGDSETGKGKKKSSTRKYVCNGCGISVRATKAVNIICGDCMDLMIKVE